MSGSKPGERRGGRKRGTPNKATAEIREHAQQYTIEALEGLALIARNSTSDAARVSAWNALLDRGYGKPTQAVEHGVEVAFEKIERVIVDTRNKGGYPRESKPAPAPEAIPTMIASARLVTRPVEEVR